MNYQQLYELQNMKLRREAMEKSYPKERELKLRKRKKELLCEKKDLLLLEEKLRIQSREVRKLHDEKASIKEEINKINENLYSNQFSAKELSTMQNKLENLENSYANRHVRIEKESSIILAKRADLKERKNILLDRMKDYGAKVEEYLQERHRLVEKLKVLDQETQDFIAEMEEKDWNFYQDESAKHGTEILCVLKKGRFCSCCSMLLESDTINDVKDSVRGLRCQNCGRIIYHMED